MHPIIYLSTAFLVAVFLFCAWRVIAGRGLGKTWPERLVVAVLFAPVGWQGLQWLRAEHVDVAQVRYVAVWLQMVAGFGVAALMLIGRTRPREEAPPV